MGFPGGASGKETSCGVRDAGSIPEWADLLEEEQPTSVFLPGESLWTEESGGLQSMGLQRVGHG